MDIIQTILPIFLIILAGLVLQRSAFPSTGFWPQAERMTYYLLFPALLIDKLTTMHAGGQPILLMAVVLIAAVCLIASLLIALRHMLPADGPAFTSIFQGAIRPNTYVGLSVAGGLYGDLGLSLAAVALMTLIPLVNVLCVLILTRHGRDAGERSLNQTVIQLLRNPLILSCLVGFAMNGAGLVLPVSLQESLRILGSASLPLGLLTVGAGLSFAAARSGWKEVGISSILKLMLLPVAAWSLGRLLGMSGTPLGICVIFTAIPVSVSSYILARVLGGDHDRMAAIITVQTMLAIVTMPVLLNILL